jgi:hypothetical protein
MCEQSDLFTGDRLESVGLENVDAKHDPREWGGCWLERLRRRSLSATTVGRLVTATGDE